MQCDESLTIDRPSAAKLVSHVSAKGTFGCLSGDVMPRSAWDLNPAYPSHGPELKRWALPIWFAAGYLSPLVRSPEKLSEPLLAPYRSQRLGYRKSEPGCCGAGISEVIIVAPYLAG